jgi:predicted N-acetyltransferase YhbS
VPEAQLILPGPVDPERFLYLELAHGALADAHGLVLPPHRFQESFMRRQVQPEREALPA